MGENGGYHFVAAAVGSQRPGKGGRPVRTSMGRTCEEFSCTVKVMSAEEWVMVWKREEV